VAIEIWGKRAPHIDGLSPGCDHTDASIHRVPGRVPLVIAHKKRGRKAAPSQYVNRSALLVGVLTATGAAGPGAFAAALAILVAHVLATLTALTAALSALAAALAALLVLLTVEVLLAILVLTVLPALIHLAALAALAGVSALILVAHRSSPRLLWRLSANQQHRGKGSDPTVTGRLNLKQ
jgi:hypothetical protein